MHGRRQWRHGPVVCHRILLTFGSLLTLTFGAAGCNCGGDLTALRPGITVDPTSISQANLCSAADYAVNVANPGRGELIIESVTVQGTGWTLAEEKFPMAIEPNGKVTFTLTTTGGTATLVINSNDLATPQLNIPLQSSMDQPPTATITEPKSGEIVSPDAGLLLEGTVTDVRDPPEALNVAWLTGTSTVLSNAPAGDGGVTTFDWSAGTRVPGTQTVTLQVTDSCGLSASQTVSFCQDSIYSYAPFQLQGWHYDGDTVWDATDQWLQITDAEEYQEGSAFQTSQTVNGDHVDITFGFYSSGGTGADGMALVALNSTQSDGTYLGEDGCGMGFGEDPSCSAGTGLPGWAVEIDTYYNASVDQTTDNHTAFSINGSLADEPAWSALPDIRDGKWHSMTVNMAAPHLQVSVDGVSYIDTTVTGDFNFPAYVGFTGSTGALTDNHLIKALDVTGHTCTMSGGATP